jgi:hypothetical protein
VGCYNYTAVIHENRVHAKSLLLMPPIPVSVLVQDPERRNRALVQVLNLPQYSEDLMIDRARPPSTTNCVKPRPVLNEEMEAAGARVFAGACNRRPTRNHCVNSPAERWSSPIDHILRPRNTLAAFEYSAQPTWMRPLRRDAKPSPPAAHRSRRASSSQCQQNRNSNPRTTETQ